MAISLHSHQFHISHFFYFLPVHQSRWEIRAHCFHISLSIHKVEQIFLCLLTIYELPIQICQLFFCWILSFPYCMRALCIVRKLREFSDGLVGWGSCVFTTVALVAAVQRRFNPWPRNSHILPVWQKKKKKYKKNERTWNKLCNSHLKKKKRKKWIFSLSSFFFFLTIFVILEIPVNEKKTWKSRNRYKY